MGTQVVACVEVKTSTEELVCLQRAVGTIFPSLTDNSHAYRLQLTDGALLPLQLTCNEMELVLLIGLQASGKSTFFRIYFANTHEHISKDLMRNNKNRNRRQAQLLSAALEAGHSVVVDNTNPTVEERAVLIQQGQQYGAEIFGYYFESNLALKNPLT